MTVEVRTVRYTADGLELEGTLAVPGDGRGPPPGVLICHEGPGLDDVQRDRATDYAELGYVAFALDYHGPLAPFADRDLMMGRLGELIADPDRTRALGRAGLDVLAAEPTVDPTRIAATGYCFGAVVAAELGRSGADLKAIVGFHPGLFSTRPQDSANIRGRVLMMIGGADPLITADERHSFEREMTEAGVDWQLHVYGGVQHSFTHPRASLANLPGIAYDERAAAHSWAEMAGLLREVFAECPGS